MLEESTAGIILNTLLLNDQDNEAALDITVPKLSINLLTGEEALTDGSLKTLSYEISYNETAEQRNQGNSFTLICALENQIADYTSVTVEPSEVRWTAENNTLRFAVPDRKMIRIRFNTVPDFTGKKMVRAVVYAGALRDGIQKEVRYSHSYSDDATVYADILTVDASNHSERVSGAEFEIYCDGKPANLSGLIRRVQTDENGFAHLCGEKDDLSNAYSWSLVKDTKYELRETKTPAGYLPLKAPIPVTIGNTANAVQGLYRSHDTVLIPYREGVIWRLEGFYTMNGREMQEDEERQFSLIPLSDSLMDDESVILPSNLTTKLSSGEGNLFSFDSVIFLKEGVYEFEIRQDNLISMGIQHQADRVLAEVDVRRNGVMNTLEIYQVTIRAEKDGISSVMSGLLLTDEYLAKGEYTVSGRITVDEANPAGESLYAVMLQNGNEIARTVCNSNGEFAFRPISFLSSMEDRSFSIEISPGEISEQQKRQGLKKPDTKVVLNLNTMDDGKGHMIVQSDYEQEIHFDYWHEKNLSIRFREHHKPTTLEEQQYLLTVITDCDFQNPGVQIRNGKQMNVQGIKDNGKTVFHFQTMDEDCIELTSLPVGTHYMISLDEHDERTLVGFTWDGQSYTTSSMEGTIGKTLPDYEILAIYPSGLYLPSAELICLNEIELERFPPFELYPGDERTEKAVKEGWIEIPENIRGKAEQLDSGKRTIRFTDVNGLSSGINIHCEGEYQFRIVPVQDESSLFCCQRDSGFLRVSAYCNGSDILQFSDECPKILCYGMESLALSIEGAASEEEFEVAASFVSETVHLEEESLQMFRNGTRESLIIEDGAALLNVKRGDSISFLLPSGTGYSFDPVSNENSSMELIADDTGMSGTLDNPATCILTVCRKEAAVSLTMTQNTVNSSDGEVQFQFFEKKTDTLEQTNLDLSVMRNGSSETLKNGSITVRNGDTVLVSGRISGLFCKVIAADAENLITQMAEDESGFAEKTELWTELRSGKTRHISVVRSEAVFEITGVLELLGGSLKKGMFEVLIDGDGEEQEILKCADSADGQWCFNSHRRYMNSLGTQKWYIRSRMLDELPTVIADPTEFTVTVTAEQEDAGTVSVTQRVSRKLQNGSMQETDEIRFTDACLFPVHLSVKTAEIDKAVSCVITVMNSGNMDRFTYAVGTRNGTFRSGESLSLCNEQATLWLPYKAQYRFTPQLPSGFVIENVNEVQLSGYAGPDSVKTELLCKYKPSVCLNGQKHTIPVQVNFEGEEWTEEQFVFSLIPADNQTLAEINKGFQFNNNSGTLRYVADAEQRQFTVSVVTENADNAAGIQVLQGGEYRFSLKQIEKTDSGIGYDDSIRELILEVRDDGEGHLYPEFHQADGDGAVCFTNKAQTLLRVTCEVACQEGQSYGLESAQKRKLPVSVQISELKDLTVTVRNDGKGGGTELSVPVQGNRIELLLKHGETVYLTGLPVGSRYTVESGSALNGYLTQEPVKTGKLVYHNDNKETFQFIYAPTGEVTVKGKVSLLYRKSLPGEKAHFVMKPADKFTREKFETGYQLEAEALLENMQAGEKRKRMAKTAFSIPRAVPAASFSFDPIVFKEPGQYIFNLYQISGNMLDTVYDDSVYQIRILVTDPNPGSGMLHAEYVILKDGIESDLSFSNAYAASGEAVIEGTVLLEGRRALADEFTFVLLDEEGRRIGSCSNRSDGGFTFPTIIYDASDIGKVCYYRIQQLSGSSGGIIYDEQEYRAIAAVKDLGKGVLTPAVAYLSKTGDGRWSPSDEIRFSNRYQAEGTLEISGDVRMLGRPFLLGESIEMQLFQETDSDDWTQIDTVFLNPGTGNRVQFSFEDVEFTLSDVVDAPMRYKIVILTGENDDIRIEGNSERVFQVDIADNGDGTLELTSSLTEEKASFTLMGLTSKSVRCEFDDDNNASGLRPENLMVRVLANGKENSRIQLSDANDWQATTGTLPMADEKGNEITYSLEPERARPYGVTLSEDDPDMAVLTARYRPHFGSDDNVLVHFLAPETGDRNPIWKYLVALSFSGLVIAVTLHYRRKH